MRFVNSLLPSCPNCFDLTPIRRPVQTKKDEWIEVKVTLDKFEATSFGRVVKDAGAVKPEEINAHRFMLGDKKAGPFKMEVESITVERAGSGESK